MAMVRMDFKDMDESARFVDEILKYSELRKWAGVILHFLEHDIILLPAKIVNSEDPIESGSRIRVPHRFAYVDFLVPTEDCNHFHVAETFKHGMGDDVNSEDEGDEGSEGRENAPNATTAQLWNLQYIPRGRHSFVPVHKLITHCIFGNIHIMIVMGKLSGCLLFLSHKN